jgi:hypothetical protein
MHGTMNIKIALSSFPICVSYNNTNIILSDNARFSLAVSSLNLLNFYVQVNVFVSCDARLAAE